MYLLDTHTYACLITKCPDAQQGLYQTYFNLTELSSLKKMSKKYQQNNVEENFPTVCCNFISNFFLFIQQQDV